LKTWNEGRPTATPKELLNEQLPFMEGLRDNRNGVSAIIVTVELL
jgi:hypothetical protein